MRSSRKTTREEVGVLRSFRQSISIEVLDDGPVQRDASDAGLRSARADPADPGSVESDRRLRTGGVGLGAGAFAVRLVAVVLSPPGPVGHRGVGVLMAHS